jgi:hypothetical protein
MYDTMWRSAMSDDEETSVYYEGDEEKPLPATPSVLNENWYILQVENSEETINQLSEAGIPCNDVRKQYKENNIAFPAYTARKRCVSILRPLLVSVFPFWIKCLFGYVYAVRECRWIQRGGVDANCHAYVSDDEVLYNCCA